MISSVESSAPTLYCTFWLQSHWFGIEARRVKEVTLTSHCTSIPHAPSGVLGYLNLRGQIYLVIDLRRKLGIPEYALSYDNRLMILRPEVAECLAVVVDRIGPIVTATAADLEALASEPSGAAIEADQAGLTLAMARLDDGLLMILDPFRFLPLVQSTNTEPRTTTA